MPIYTCYSDSTCTTSLGTVSAGGSPGQTCKTMYTSTVAYMQTQPQSMIGCTAALLDEESQLVDEVEVDVAEGLEADPEAEAEAALDAAELEAASGSELDQLV
eukprot:tig00020710_g13327.t1